jgi:peptide-methionine (S)-S-oxide reductase
VHPPVAKRLARRNTVIMTRRAVLSLAFVLLSSPAMARPPADATAYFAGGCFWGVEAVFEHVKGVKDAVSGFATGADSAVNGPLRPGHTSYAETVRVTYDPAQVSYEQLLRIFFTVAHDPTQLDRQGPDVGAEYRSTIFYESDEQARATLAFMGSLASAHTVSGSIVTEVVRLREFEAAPPAHQDFMKNNPNAPYVVINDKPKIAKLRHDFPELFRDRGWVRI